MSLNQWFEKGLSPKQYMETLKKHKEGFMHIYQEFELQDDGAFLQSLKERKLRVIVLAEGWCGHCMLNIPVLLRLAEEATIPVSFLPRDENLELMDQYLTNEKRIIPIFIFIDENGNEVAKWGPKSEYTAKLSDKQAIKLPPKDAADYQEKFKEMAKSMTKSFRDNSEFWNATYQSMKDTLTN